MISLFAARDIKDTSAVSERIIGSGGALVGARIHGAAGVTHPKEQDDATQHPGEHTETLQTFICVGGGIVGEKTLVSKSRQHYFMFCWR